MKHLVLLTICLTAITTSVFASGLNRIGGIGSRAGAMSGAFIATADDSTLFYYNPAGMSQFATTYADFGNDFIFTGFKYKGNKANEKMYVMPYGGIIHPLTEKINIGLGLTVPYGLGASFSKNSSIPKSESLLSLTNITPAVSLRLTENLYLGIGLNIGLADFNYRSPFDIGGVFTPIDTKSSANGIGIGTTIGILYYPTQKLSLGLSYMSEMKVDLDGKTNISGIRDNFKSSFTFPPRLGIGIAYAITDRLKLEADVNWHGYSKSVNNMTLKFKNLSFEKTNVLDWRDNCSFHLGAQYLIGYSWWLRAGVSHQTATIPDATISQLTPDTSGNCVSVGIEKQKENLYFSLSALYGYGSNRVSKKIGVPHHGKYEATMLTVSASVGWQF